MTYATPATAEPVLVAHWGSGEPLETAKQSALYRATHRIKGHTDLDSGRMSGVGYSFGSQSNTPRTCHWSQRRRGSYAAYRVGKEVYSTLLFAR